jgi:hypothetical protein
MGTAPPPGVLPSVAELVNGAIFNNWLCVVGSGGSVICKECPGRDVGGQRTRTRRGPAWTVNSAPGRTPGGTVTR